MNHAICKGRSSALFPFLLRLQMGGTLKENSSMKNEEVSTESHIDINSLTKAREVEIIYISPVRKHRINILTSRDAYDVFCRVFDGRKIDLKEMFYVLLLNRANICLGYSQIGVGNIAGVCVNKIEIFQLAILSNASNIILCHNHPSGNLQPSEADKKLTKEVLSGCKIFDIKFLDHLIISSEGFTSMADECLM